jgi:ribonuclease R
MQSGPIRKAGGAGGSAALEGRVCEVETPSASGQRVIVEDRGGRRWRVECPGEPLEIGARILFEPLGGAEPHGSKRGGKRGVLAPGEMVRLLEARRSEWVCTLHGLGARLRPIPFGGLPAPELDLAAHDAQEAHEGERVVVVPAPRKGRTATRRERRGRRALPVRVVERLGQAGEPEADHRALVWKHRLVTRFPRRARLEAAAIEESLDAAERARRLDLRELPFITIDPASARDHDDAVYAEERATPDLEPVGSGAQRTAPEAAGAARSWVRRLWVAIADVAHFVPRGSAIDSEARRRGNSIYFPDRAIPMLPETLSSGVCSLRPEVDRLAMVVELRLAADGRVADALFHEALIRSRARLSYEEAAAWLDRSEVAPGPAPVWGNSLRLLDGIASGLLEARRRSGATLLELPELEIRVDAAGRPVDCALRERNRAHILIEEAMLAANRAVARALDRAGRPTIHRGHAPPSPARLATLAALAERLGLSGSPDAWEASDPRVLTALLEESAGTPLQERVHMAVLRSMSQARYEPDSKGHYALQFDDYLHFTSPIRRYADLEAHRGLKQWLKGVSDERANTGEVHERNARLAIWLSGRERLSIDVEREAQALACCALLRGREGEPFRASVTGVAEAGLFVRLDAPAASGLVPMSRMAGFWSFDPEDEELVQAHSGARIGLGARLEVRLVTVDLDRGRLAFAPVDRDPGRGRTQGSQASSRAASSSERRSQSR